jgi:uncharacterized protein DUF3883
MSSEKIAVKKLTASDLTFFEEHFMQNPAGNQKAINLNADIFVRKLYPSLPETDIAKTGRIPLDLFIYGPGEGSELNLQRKIIKQGSYKNYRLDGEFIRDDPARFRPLTPGDFTVFDFTGDLHPTSARVVFVAKALAEDAALHGALDALVGTRKMISISSAQLATIITTAGVPDSHPINELTLESALVDAAQEGLWGQQKLLRRRSGNRLSKEQLQKAREKADDIGRNGEEWVSIHLARLQAGGEIAGFEWTSLKNAVSPYDFRVTLNSGEIINIDAKTTLGGFESRIHISLSELYQMKDGAERYDIYRVFNVGEDSAQLRIAQDVRSFAESVMSVLASMPAGITADSVSATLSPAPAPLVFGATIVIEQTDDIVEESPLF